MKDARVLIVIILIVSLSIQPCYHQHQDALSDSVNYKAVKGVLATDWFQKGINGKQFCTDCIARPHYQHDCFRRFERDDQTLWKCLDLSQQWRHKVNATAGSFHLMQNMLDSFLKYHDGCNSITCCNVDTAYSQCFTENYDAENTSSVFNPFRPMARIDHDLQCTSNATLSVILTATHIIRKKFMFCEEKLQSFLVDLVNSILNIIRINVYQMEEIFNKFLSMYALIDGTEKSSCKRFDFQKPVSKTWTGHKCESRRRRHTSSDLLCSQPFLSFLSMRNIKYQLSVIIRPLTQFLPSALQSDRNRMSYPGYRLASLSALPASVPLFRTKLASSGFYYQGQGDELVCYACDARYSGWRSGDDPLDIHRRLSPQCPHLQSITQATSPKRSSDGQHLANLSATSDSSFHGSQLPTSVKDAIAEDGETEREDRSFDASRSVSNGGISRKLFPKACLDLSGAVYPMYQNTARRMRTFTRWDATRSPPMRSLAESGMFYAGYEDCTRCFYCGLGLKSWKINDDVWKEHLKWRPSCEYVKAVKGGEFVRNILTEFGIEANSSGNSSAGLRSDGAEHRQRTGNDVQHDVTRLSSSFTPTLTSCSAGSAVVSNSNQMASLSTFSASTNLAAVVSELWQDEIDSSGNNERHSGIHVMNPVRQSGINVINPENGAAGYQRALQEHQELSRRFQCRICHQNPVDTIYLPCGHVVTCESCAAAQSKCRNCGGIIRGTAKVYFN